MVEITVDLNGEGRTNTSSTGYFDYTIDSAVVQTDSGEGRIGHVSAIWPISQTTLVGDSEEPIRQAALYYVYYYAAAYMAMEHFNSRSGAVVAELPELLNGCDFKLTMDVRDDKGNARDAVKALQDALSPSSSAGTTADDDSSSKKNPFAIWGTYSSGVCAPMSILTDVFEIVQMAGSASSTMLEKSHHFTRTVPTNQGEASALMVHLNSINVDRIAILFVQDAFGEGFYETMSKEATAHNISIALSTSYQDHSQESMETSMEILKTRDVRYVVAIVHSFNWKPVVRAAHKYGIMGGQSGRQWYMAEYKEMQRDDFALDAVAEADIAEAIHGMGILALHNFKVEPFELQFEKFMLAKDDNNELIDNTTMRDRFINSHLEPELYDNVAFLPPQTNIYHYTVYDSIMALGVAACRTPGAFKTKEFFTELVNSEFPGASGWVALDRTTGTRLTKDLEFRLDNILLSPNNSTNTSLHFTSHTTVSIRGSNVSQFPHAFVYADNTTTPPPALPPISSHDYNLIPKWALGIGWVLGGFVLVLSAGLALWTLMYCKKHFVRVSQPIFLCQLCLGTFLMGLTVIPLSQQETLMENGTLSSPTNLNASCMATPWLFCTGFVLVVSAILAKTLRLNKLIGHSQSMKRLAVKATDVLHPLIILMSCNIALLLACNLVAPFTWHRVIVENNVDAYGRSIESYGTCQLLRASSGSGTDMTSYYFLCGICFVNFIGLCLALYQFWVARHIPTEMSESSNIFVSTLSLLEVLIIGGPILLIPSASPTTTYLAKVSITFLACLSILLPIYVPKHLKQQTGESVTRRTTPIDMRVINNLNDSHHSQPRGRVSGLNYSEQLRSSNTWGKMTLHRHGSSGFSDNSAAMKYKIATENNTGHAGTDHLSSLSWGMDSSHNSRLWGMDSSHNSRHTDYNT